MFWKSLWLEPAPAPHSMDDWLTPWNIRAWPSKPYLFSLWVSDLSLGGVQCCQIVNWTQYQSKHIIGTNRKMGRFVGCHRNTRKNAKINYNIVYSFWRGGRQLLWVLCSRPYDSRINFVMPSSCSSLFLQSSVGVGASFSRVSLHKFLLLSSARNHTRAWAGRAALCLCGIGACMRLLFTCGTFQCDRSGVCL